MNNKAGLAITLTLLLGIGVLQILFLAEELDSHVLSTYGGLIDYASYAYYVMGYIATAALIWIEIRHLSEFQIDRFALATLVLSSFIRRRRGLPGEGYFLILIALAGISILLALAVRRPNIPRTNLRWAVIGVASGGVIAVLLGLCEVSLRQTWAVEALYKNSLVLTAIQQVSNGFSFAPLMEEILFRGFLWGYLRERGWQESKVFWVQGTLFWILHFSRLVTPFSFLVALPIVTCAFSWLRSRAKQVYSSVLAHIIVDAASAVLNLATY